eukprot:3932050-Rhodomonas_salina.3
MRDVALLHRLVVVAAVEEGGRVRGRVSREELLLRQHILVIRRPLVLAPQWALDAVVLQRVVLVLGCVVDRGGFARRGRCCRVRVRAHLKDGDVVTSAALFPAQLRQRLALALSLRLHLNLPVDPLLRLLEQLPLPIQQRRSSCLVLPRESFVTEECLPLRLRCSQRSISG